MNLHVCTQNTSNNNNVLTKNELVQEYTAYEIYKS